MNHFKTFHSITSRSLATWLAICVCSMPAMAGELVYVPTNPTFGGNPNNASGLLAVANAQNDHKAPVTPKAPKEPEPEVTALDKFTASVQAGILTRLRNDAVDELYPENGVPTVGKWVDAGNFQIKLEEGENSTLIMITKDKATDQETKIVVGNYTAQEVTAP
jgi:curli production assembly/transport component CsgF